MDKPKEMTRFAMKPGMSQEEFNAEYIALSKKYLEDIIYVEKSALVAAEAKIKALEAELSELKDNMQDHIFESWGDDN